MKLIVQQVKEASVLLVDSHERRSIQQGIIVYVCFEWEDVDVYGSKIEKSIKLLGKMKMLSLWSSKIDQTLADVNAELLIISNFSIAGRMKKWTKVDFSRSASYDEALHMYNDFVLAIKNAGYSYKTGEFGAKMQIDSSVYWPLNYIIEM